jgi:hypothetical protein
MKKWIGIVAALMLLASIILVFTLTRVVSSGKSQVAAQPTGSQSGFQIWPQVTYGHDGYSQGTCSGTDALDYSVFAPTSPGPHPIVFGISGSGFQGSAGCVTRFDRLQENYSSLNYVMEQWAKAGYVAVNIEYHGYSNGLFGDVTYPGIGKWGTRTDATVQLDIVPAIKYFLANNPAQYGANSMDGIVIFGSSSGAHDAYMIASVGIPGVKICAVIGWSGLPDVSKAGSYPESVFDTYMQTTPGSDVENFGDPDHRISSSMPPVYIANGLKEFINPANAEQYARDLTAHGVINWLRILDTSAHAQAYSTYTFTGQSPEVSIPAAQIGTTVLNDSIAFANKYLKGCN